MAEGSITSNVHDFQDPETGRFLPGKVPNPKGRPRGTVSIKRRITDYLNDHPEKLEELMHYYLNNQGMRDLLWKMIDGMPRQQTDITSGGKPIPILNNVSDNNGNQENTGT